MYKRAAQLKLRFDTDKGRVSVEDLFSFSLPQLDVVGKALRKSVKDSEEESLIGETSNDVAITKLKFDLVLDVIATKKAAIQDATNASANKALKQELLAELEARQKDSLKNLSEDELRRKLAELG